MKLSIVVPVYNESRTIESILGMVRAVTLPSGMEKEIIVVDDASYDGTRDILKRLESVYDLKLIFHEKNRGKGAAMRTGLGAATGDFTVIQDADLEYDPNEYSKLLEPLLSGKTDVAYGSRYLGKRQRDLFSVNYFANQILTAVTNFFTGGKLSDMETCHKMYSRRAYQAIMPVLKSERFDIEPEITVAAARQGFRIVEVPISYEPRTARQGKKIKWHDGFPAVWAIVKFGLPGFWQRRKWPISLVLSLATLVILFGAFLGPNILGDTPSYIDTMAVMQTDVVPPGFIPNRILTTFLGIQSVRVLSVIAGGIYPAWFFLNALLYFIGCIFFFKLLARIFQSDRVAYIGAMFLAANYGCMIFGLNYLMDIGGWAFFILSIYFLWKYSQSKRDRDIFLSAFMVGVGGLFKEYAFLAAVAIAVYLIVEHRKNVSLLFTRALQTAAIALIPTLLLYAYIYVRFGYTYLDWLGFNSGYYVYSSRIVEYVKALGSLVNVLAFMFIGGAVVLVQKWKDVGREVKLFLAAVLISFLPIFMWPAITQRILTITIPFIVLVSCFLFNKYERKWYVFLPVVVIYVLATFFMDSFILQAVNMPF